jgi:glycosyltransferase involved in cell wall biosynthesis
MKIIFDLRKTGLGNNGGSSTLINSGNTLVDMGHEVVFIDSMKNKHTWTPLKADHKIVRNEIQIPAADAIIATGYKSVGPTMKAPKVCGIKMHWIRAWEFWQYGESAIIKKVLKPKTIKLVNSICLKNKLKNYGFESHIIRPGYDFEKIYPMELRKKKKGIVIGGLYREGVHGRRKRTSWLFDAARNIKSKYPDVEFWLFGSESPPSDMLVDVYRRSPLPNEKNIFYNNIDVWMAPTMSEGLHLPPAEAMMTGCPVVSTDAELSGTQDYVIHGSTGLMAKNNLPSFINAVETLVKNPEERRRMGKNAIKKINDIGDRKTNMQKLVDLIESKRG